MRCFRIADPRFPIFDGTGAGLYGGRWNSPGQPVIYTAETYSGAILEILVHTRFARLPNSQSGITITIPPQIATETVNSESLPDWQSASQLSSRTFGDLWLRQRRSPVLIVPSIVTRGREHNLLLNPAHPDFPSITYTAPEPVFWDERLFQQ